MGSQVRACSSPATPPPSRDPSPKFSSACGAVVHPLHRQEDLDDSDIPRRILVRYYATFDQNRQGGFDTSATRVFVTFVSSATDIAQ